MLPPKCQYPSHELASFSQEMKALGIKIINYELHVSWEQADKKIADFFRISEGKKVLKLNA